MDTEAAQGAGTNSGVDFVKMSRARRRLLATFGRRLFTIGLPIAVVCSVVSALMPWSLILHPMSITAVGAISLETNIASAASADEQVETNALLQDFLSSIDDAKDAGLLGENGLISIPEDTGYLWRNSAMQIYSLGQTLRCLEITSYVRAYKDTELHIYTVDTPFTVAKEDINSVDELSKAEVYVDSKGITYKEGEIATHYAGESLPGSFPLWLEREEEPRAIVGSYEIDFTGLPFPASIIEVNVDYGNGWELAPKEIDEVIRKAFKNFTYNVGGWYDNGLVTIPKPEKWPDKVAFRILYDKIDTSLATGHTFYFESTQLFSKVWRCAEADPTGIANEATSIRNGTGAVNRYYSFCPGITDSTTYSSAFIVGDTNGAHGWRSLKTYSGDFAEGDWVIHFTVKNRAAYAHSGRVWARIYHTYVNDPTVAQLTQMNSVNTPSSIISFSAMAGEEYTGTVTVNCDQNLHLNGECIFVVLNWQVTTRGTNSNAGVKFIVNDGLEYVDNTEFTHNDGMIQPIPCHVQGLAIAAATNFGMVMGMNTDMTVEAYAWAVIPTGGALSDLYCQLSAAPAAAGDSHTISISVNGSIVGAPTVTIENAATTGNDTVNSIDVVAGDTVSYKIVTANTPAFAHLSASCYFTGTTANESICLGNAYCLKTGNYFNGIQSTCQSATEANAYQIIPTAGTLKKLYVQLSIRPGAASDAYTFTVKHDTSTTTGITCTITDPNLTGSDVVNTHAVAAGTDVDLAVVPVSVPANNAFAGFGLVFLADTDGESIILGGTGDDLSNAAVENIYLCHGYLYGIWVATASEALVLQLLNACTLQKFYVELSGNPYANSHSADTYTFTVRLNSGSPANGLVAVVTSDTNVANDTAHTITVASGNTVDLMNTPASSPTVRDAYWGVVAYIEPPVSCTPDIANDPSSKAFGVVSASSTYYAKGSAPANPVVADNCTYTITNNSGGAIDVNIHGHAFTGGVGWSLTAGAPGENTVRITAYYVGQNPASGVVLTTSDQLFYNSLADAATIMWDFKLETPSSFTDGVAKSSTITLTAVCE